MNTPFVLEPKISTWLTLVRNAGCSVRKIKPLSLTRKKNGELLFALLDADIRSPEGYRLPNIVFIRGDACLIVPLVRNRATGEERFLMVRQRRIGSGSASLEFPAGMLDGDTGDPAGVAARELAEETGLRAGDALFPLRGGKLFSSVGACDEGVYYYGCVKEIEDAEWRALARGPSAGNPDENERISVALVTREEAESGAISLQVYLGLHLFDAWRKRNAPLR
jgi:ADP-sugar diphosphatase